MKADEPKRLRQLGVLDTVQAAQAGPESPAAGS